MPITKQRRINRFNDSKQYLEHRDDIVTKTLSKNWDDGWAYDKNFLRSFKKVFYCKWCGQEMYAAEYDGHGSIIMSCRKPLCPGNINGDSRHKINYKTVDHRAMTNQYLFDSRCKF